jgi:putative FmdB family regulatory protein
MPTYEYECRTNGHRFEVKQSFSDPAIEACEVCGEPVRKIFSAAGIVFKGSGYYVTDTRKKASKAKPEGGGTDGGSGGADGGGSGGAGGGGSGGTAEKAAKPTSDAPSGGPAAPKTGSAAPAASGSA